MRLTNRLLSILIALGSMAAAGAVAIESVAGLFDAHPLLLPLNDWNRRLVGVEWGHGAMRWTLIGLIISGALLVLLQVWPRRPVGYGRQVERSTTGERTVVLNRKGLEEHLSTTAKAHPGVLSGSVRMRKRRAQATVSVPARTPDSSSVREDVRRELTKELEGLRLHRRPRVDVRVDEAKRRVL